MRHKIDQTDYDTLKGENWPTWEEFLKGSNTGVADVDVEIDDFVKKFAGQGKYFPIKTATACQSKWTWNTLWLNEARSGSCHRAGYDNVTVENFNLHN